MTETKLKRLPLGISTFSEIIQDNYVYVDKTELIYQLVTDGSYYFLLRPPHFGKSLLVSTLAELFAGKKELFKNLWIASSDYSWPQHPVIHLDFSNIGHLTTQELIINLDARLTAIAHDYAIDVTSFPSIGSKFHAIIVQLARRNKVVILIDEYDKPIRDHIDNPHEAQAHREVLMSLYSIIKGSDQYLRFVLLIGVAKFSITTIFSGLNNLTNISMDTEYATMLGYTHREVIDYFPAYLERLAKKQKASVEIALNTLTNYYDGYQFAEGAERVFNPYSVLRCYDEGMYKNYWPAAEASTFPIKLLQTRGYDLGSITQPILNEYELGSFEPDNIPLSSLLLQTGYLTIKDFDPKVRNYTLGIPNREVAQAFNLLLGINFDAHASRVAHK